MKAIDRETDRRPDGQQSDLIKVPFSVKGTLKTECAITKPKLLCKEKREAVKKSLSVRLNVKITLHKMLTFIKVFLTWLSKINIGFGGHRGRSGTAIVSL